MTIVINEVKLATELAHDVTKDELICSCYTEFTVEEDLWIYDEESEMDVYKKEVQAVFDRWYDYFYDIIINAKENE